MPRLLFLLVGTVLLASCTSGSHRPEDYSEYKKCLQECPAEEDQVTCQDTCLLTLAQAENNARFCDDIQVSSLRSSCYIDIAIVTEDSTLCATVDSPKFCYMTLAAVLEDPSICERIDSAFVVEACKKNALNVNDDSPLPTE